MKIFSVTDPEFKPYGRVVTGLDTAKAEILAALANTPLPAATDYVAEDAALQELPAAVESQAPLAPPRLGRVSRRVKSFPIAPRVDLRPDDKAQRWLLTVTASDRVGLLYSIARVLAAHGINLELAKVSTLGERVEDMFLLQGAQLQHNKTQLAIEQELLDVLEPQ